MRYFSVTDGRTNKAILGVGKTIEKTYRITWSSTSLLTRDGALGGSSLAHSRCLQPTLLHPEHNIILIKSRLGHAGPWVESPKLALAVLKAESSTRIHIPTLDPFLCVKVVPGVLRVLFNCAL